jgi:small subunit ribosomal protein S16
LVKIRLARMGNRKRPFYRMVVAEDSHRRDGRFIEIVGTYDPLRKPAAIEVHSEAVLRWLARGAQPTETVRRILTKCGLWAHWRAVQEGKAALEEMSGPLTGTLERSRPRAPSKKTATRIDAETAARTSGGASGEEGSGAAEAEGAEAGGGEEGSAGEGSENSENDAEPETAEEPRS